jgi:hypothetical protein
LSQEKEQESFTKQGARQMTITIQAVDGFQWKVVDSDISILRKKRNGIIKFNVIKLGSVEILASCDSKEEAIAWIQKAVA